MGDFDASTCRFSGGHATTGTWPRRSRPTRDRKPMLDGPYLAPRNGFAGKSRRLACETAVPRTRQDGPRTAPWPVRSHCARRRRDRRWRRPCAGGRRLRDDRAKCNPCLRPERRDRVPDRRKFCPAGPALHRLGGTVPLRQEGALDRGCLPDGVASILAGVLYALGFAAFALEGLGRAIQLAGRSADWVHGPAVSLSLASAATAFYTIGLMRTAGGRGNAATIGKVIVFAVLLGGGTWVWIGESPFVLLARLRPFLSAGPGGLVQAMGTPSSRSRASI